MLLIPLKMKVKNGVNLCVLANRLRSLVKNACACGGLGGYSCPFSCNRIEKLFMWPYGENFHRAFFVLELGGEEWAGGSPERFKGGLKGF